MTTKKMPKGKKYAYNVTQSGDTWVATISRQVTSKKTIITTAQDGFNSEAEATEWATTKLTEFTNTLSTSNERHGKNRKQNEEIRRQRSSRRAEKTEQAKLKIGQEQKRANELDSDASDAEPEHPTDS